MNLKDYEINPDRINYGYCTNNSIVVESTKTDYLDIIKRIKKNGEPGIIILDNIKNYSRMFQPPDYKDDYENVMVNPCSESNLRSHEFCNLSEVFLNKIDNLIEFCKVLKYAFLYCKIISMIKTGIEKSDKIIEQNRRVGVSLSGITQCLSYVDCDMMKFISWLSGEKSPASSIAGN